MLESEVSSSCTSSSTDQFTAKGRFETTTFFSSVGFIRVGFARVVNFRPGMMKPVPGQKNVPGLYHAILTLYPIVSWLAPNSVCTIQQVGVAMIHAATGGSAKTVLEVPEIKALADS